VKVYALVGPSGTGKSYKAISFANEHGIECIIDDGLLIKGGKILAGTSAKKEPTTIAAIRRAIFMDEAHANEVRQTIEDIEPESLIMLGTSINMKNKIGENLQQPRPQEKTR